MGIVLGVLGVSIEKKLNDREAQPLINAMNMVTGINGMKYDIKPGANLVGAKLVGLDLTGADLTGANLTPKRHNTTGKPSSFPDERWKIDKTNYNIYYV